jgi:hypothetical protein
MQAEFEVLGPSSHSKARAESKPIHNSFLEDALKLRDAKMGDGSKNKHAPSATAVPPPAEDSGSRHDTAVREEIIEEDPPAPKPPSVDPAAAKSEPTHRRENEQAPARTLTENPSPSRNAKPRATGIRRYTLNRFHCCHENYLSL